VNSASFDFQQILPYALFGLVAAVAWWALDFLTTTKSRAVERLDELKNPEKRRREIEGGGRKFEAMTRVLEKASMAAKPLQSSNAAETSKLKIKLTSAGFRGEATPSIFLGLKFIGLIVGFVIGGGVVLLTSEMSMKSLLYVVGTAGGMFYLPEIILWIVRRNRKQAIFLSMPDALDLLVVCVEAGLGLDQALRKVTEEMRGTAPVLCEEFSLANLQIQMGGSRSESLHELGVRTDVEDVRSLAAIIIQAEKFGSSIAQALRVQSDSMRTRRRQLAEEKAAKTAVKLIFPLVLFIFPGIFVVLVGPAAITIVRDMFPKMSGG
jgi:tight adherence protein C